MIKVLRTILGVFLFLAFFQANAQVLENYNPHITTVKKHEFSLSPVMASVAVNVEDYPSSAFEMKFPTSSAVFVGNQLWFYTKSDTSFLLPLSAFREQFPEVVGKVDIEVYRSGIREEDISIKKGVFRSGLEVDGGKNVEGPQLREKDYVRDFLILALVIILALIALFKVTYPLMFRTALRPVSIFSEDFSEPGTGGKVFSSDMIYNILVFSMLLTLFIMSGIHFTEVPFLERYLRGDINFLFLVWLSGTAVFMVLSVFKYLWVKMFASVYQIERWDFRQFFYLMRGLVILMLLCFVVIIVFYIQGFTEMDLVLNYAVSLFFLVYLLGVFRLFYIMLKKVPFKSYHLFSYICSSELVPFLVIAKIVLG
ncbi:DUF4271 domain-containing protein [Echinicola salinicaeni]|uniref:DUF4271 domain-containing protein n=1 Tax=Echinicola salinicaeni TaxID=2762757 RepID=UPI0016493B9D|nr:DUF4271 domain-containing protein [Echinicola salinicaeni]